MSNHKAKFWLTAVSVTLATILVFANRAHASGVFEINFSSFVDSLGRDLRQECCSWQNNSIINQNQPAHNNNNNNNNPANQQCDPTKCQLIIRICVTNYQTQIDPSQCTFGELSAQVMRPNEPAPYAPYARFPLLRHIRSLEQSIAYGGRPATRAPKSSPAYNIHHQRMLQQQQQLYQAPFSHQQGHTSMGLSSQRANGASSFHHQQQQQAQFSVHGGQPRAMRTIAFNQPISFPFNFTWPGTFSLVIDAWYESPTGQLQQAPLPFASAVHQASHHRSHLAATPTTYDLYKKQLIIRRAMHGWLSVQNEWTGDVYKTEFATLTYSYRVTCQPNYFGEQCNILCRPRDDVYGHYTCSNQGLVLCLPGWQGSYCLDPICSPGCHKDQGNCSRPNECNCRSGWEGASCEQCIRYPGCVHGSCNKPYECNCEEGWGGLLCNEDLKFCSNHQPCKNGALCTNAFDSNGIGSYTCTCAAGFTGKNCEKSLSSPSSANDFPQLTNDTQISSNHSSKLIVQTQNSAPSQTNNMISNLNQQQVPLALKPNPVKPTSPQPSKLASINAYPSDTNGPLSYYGHYTQPVTQQQPTMDAKVVVAYAIIVACMVILVVVLLLRIFFERTSHRQWQQENSHVEDVATLQNHQNIYKSRTSLSTDTIGYGPLDLASSSTSSIASNSHATLVSTLNAQSSTDLRGHMGRRANRDHSVSSSKYSMNRSQHNLMAACSGPPIPPPPYTISHSHTSLSPYGQISQPANLAASSNPYGSINSTYQSPYYVIYQIVKVDPSEQMGNNHESDVGSSNK